MDEAHYAEIDVAMLYIEEARARVDKAAANLRTAGAEPHLIVALENARQQLSEVNKRLSQKTLFAVPSAQTSF